MIQLNVSLDSSGRARLDGKEHELLLGYSANRNVYTINVLATIPEDYSDTVARVSALESCGFVVVDGKVCMKYVKS